jgi:hypothetical protein
MIEKGKEDEVVAAGEMYGNGSLSKTNIINAIRSPTPS